MVLVNFSDLLINCVVVFDRFSRGMMGERGENEITVIFFVKCRFTIDGGTV